MSSGLSDFLNFSRWWAAFAVLLSHARSLLFVDYESIESPGIIDSFFYFISGFGHEAVMIFFVMSGYLVGGKAIERIRGGSFNTLGYAVDRFSRLYAVYFVALVLTYLCDSTGGHLFAESGLYNGDLQGIIPTIDGSFIERHDWQTFLGNMFMLQTIVVPVFGSNGPLWSLANETVYYILGPILIASVYVAKGWWRVISFVAVLIPLAILPAGIYYGFLIWLAGAAFVYARGGHGMFLLPGVVLFAGTLTASRFDLGVPYQIGQLLIATSFLIVMYGFHGLGFKLPFSKTWKYLADFSYSLYLLHFPVVLLFVGLLFHLGVIDPEYRLLPSTASYLCLLASLFIVVLTSWAISLITEAQTFRFRSRLRSWVRVG